MSLTPFNLSSGPYVLSSSRLARSLEDPLIFSEDYTPVTHWYNLHRSHGSTIIRKLQLRKERLAPFHQFIIVLTRGDHTYRVDRGRDGPVLDTMTKEGVLPQDTIALLPTTSLVQLDKTSYSMIEMLWKDDRTIDLRLILEICFQIHNETGKRYKLLTYNCYFFAQTITMIVVRKMATNGAKADEALNTALKHCINWELIESTARRTLVRVLVRMQEWIWDRRRVGGQGELEPELDRELRRELPLELRLDLERAVGEALLKAIGGSVGGSVGEVIGKVVGEAVGRELGVQLGRELGVKGGSDLFGDLWGELWEKGLERLEQDMMIIQVGCWNWWGKSQMKKLQREYDRHRRLDRQREKERQLEQEPQLQLQLQRLERGWMLALEQVQMTTKTALLKVLEQAMRGELDPGWHKKWNRLESLDAPAAQTSAAKDLTSTCARWFIENLGRIVIRQMKEVPFLDSPFSQFVEFPASFSAMVKISSEAPDLPLGTLQRFEAYMKYFIERHVNSVPRGLRSRGELKEEIVNGMTATWHLAAPQFQRGW